jgi:hypothetical protein
MTVSWVVETNVFAEVCFDQMIEHFRKNDIPYSTVRIIPFSHEIDGKKPVVVGPVVAYGSIGIQQLAKREGWEPGVFGGDGFSETTARAALGDLFLNSDCQEMLLSEVFAYVEKNEMDYFFIKPNTDTKEFAGTTMGFEDFAKWRNQMIDTGYLQESDFNVVVSRPKKLGCEWRVVVVDGKISESSIYRQYGIVKPERHIILEVEALVYEAHARFVPAPVYVIDVAQVKNGDDWDYKIIEYNTFNSAGLYACDVGVIIDDINAIVGE